MSACHERLSGTATISHAAWLLTTSDHNRGIWERIDATTRARAGRTWRPNVVPSSRSAKDVAEEHARQSQGFSEGGAARVHRSPPRLQHSNKRLAKSQWAGTIEPPEAETTPSEELTAMLRENDEAMRAALAAVDAGQTAAEPILAEKAVAGGVPPSGPGRDAPMAGRAGRQAAQTKRQLPTRSSSAFELSRASATASTGGSAAHKRLHSTPLGRYMHPVVRPSLYQRRWLNNEASKWLLTEADVLELNRRRQHQQQLQEAKAKSCEPDGRVGFKPPRTAQVSCSQV